MRISRVFVAVLGVQLAAALASAQTAPMATPAAKPPTKETYKSLIAEVEANLQKEILDKWFPVAVDEQGGGFFENYSADWTRGATGEKNIVYQGRLTWLSAKAAQHLPDKAEQYLALTRRGAAVLADKMWDKERGGFYWSVNNAGQPVRDGANQKHVYGNAFAVYALAASYHATHDKPTLELAKKGFQWLEEHAHDAKDGGYIEALTLDGKPMPATMRGNDAIGTQFGRKSMNTHIHVLEAFTGLYEVWHDDAVRKRMDEVFDLSLKKIYAEPGRLHMFFSTDWTPVAGRDSFGHDIEAGYLLAEAAKSLDKPNDEATWKAARQLVDHALSVGFDKERGGFYDSGTVEGGSLMTNKIWWVEAEGLNALLLMHERFGKETPKYWEAFVKQWEFISKYQVDAMRGGWYPTVSAAGMASGRIKSDRWTECYHQGRAMLNVSAALHRLAEEK